MPKIRPSAQRLDRLSEVMQAANAQRLVVGWLVAREAGLSPDLYLSPFGSGVMGKWRHARNLPAMLRAYQPEGRLFYRLRALCLQLHDHPFAAICGGPERWWQHILEEQILSAVCYRLGPQLFPDETPLRPRQRATASWWMRRGINPTNPITEPATWALTEVAQSRIFRGRGQAPTPSAEATLPTDAVNGVMTLDQRKALLERLSGSRDGWAPYTAMELFRDWSEVLIAWKDSGDNAKPTKAAVVTTRNPMWDQTLAVLIHDALIPPWWASRQAIYEGLENKYAKKNQCP